jgi:hypothetical protein
MTPRTLSKLLKALSVRLVVEPLPASGNDWEKPSPLADLSALDKKTLRRMWASEGGRKRALLLSPQRRRQIAKLGAWERWRPKEPREAPGRP